MSGLKYFRVSKWEGYLIADNLYLKFIPPHQINPSTKGLDACVEPVLEVAEAATHPHNKLRG